MSKKTLTVTLHIGGKQVETLTEEQRNRVAKRFSEATSIYYTAHPEEYVKLKDSTKETKESNVNTLSKNH